jgi:hypothetical protein
MHDWSVMEKHRHALPHFATGSAECTLVERSRVARASSADLLVQSKAIRAQCRVLVNSYMAERDKTDTDVS